MNLKSPFFYLILSSLIWGATAPIMKLTLVQIPIFSLIFLRMGIASILLLPFVYKNLKIEKTDFKLLFAAAFSGVSLNLVFFFLGLKLTQAINAAVLVAAAPIFTLFAANLYLKEKLSSRLFFAAAISTIGVLIIIGTPIVKLDFKSSIGNIFLILSSVAWVGHEIFAKKLLKKYQASTITFYTTLVGGFIFTPLVLTEFINKPSWFLNLNVTSLVGLLYGILFASFIAYWAWQKGLSLIPAGQASFFFYLEPISGAILA